MNPRRAAVNIEESTDEPSKLLAAGMILEGVVTNVTNFGAFVDIGAQQDGLVHISALSNSYVKDPNEVVKNGDLVKVKVLEVDSKRGRIALSMRLDSPEGDKKKGGKSPRNKSSSNKSTVEKKVEKKTQAPLPGGIMAEAFANARKQVD